jgi:hypothetical protein
MPYDEIMFELENERPALPCAEKLPFVTAEEARAAAVLATHRYGSKLKVYRCRYCGRWHLSSS